MILSVLKFLLRAKEHVLLKNIFNRWDGKLRKYADRYLFRRDLENDMEFQKLYQRVGPTKYTMTSMEKCYSLYKAIQYIANGDIPGDIVECGVWRGGSAMLSALTLIELKQTQRKIYLYDTYEGMPEPTEKDIDIHGIPYRLIWQKEKDLLTVPLGEVKKNMFSTGYPSENLIFVKGKVENTIPRITPYQVALLRLDTDFYESTYHELVHLYPKVSPRGVILVDDYGHFQGAREGTDKYFNEFSQNILLHRIDYSCRVGIKP